MTKNIALKMENGDAAPDGAAIPETPDVVDLEPIAAIVEKHAGTRGGLIAILEEIQGHYGYLPEKALRRVAEKTGGSLVDLYSVATFYSSFSLKPRGRHVVCACMGTACHVRGASGVVDAFERRLGIRAGETTPDKEFTLETVNCLGACALGPVVVMDGRYYSKVKKSGVRQLLETDADAGGPLDDPRNFPIEASCPRCNRGLMDPATAIDNLPAIRISWTNGHRHGRMHLSAVYGSPHVKIEHDIAPGTVLNFLCPHCHGELNNGDACFECGAPLADMIVIGGGMLKICTRTGCKGRMLDLA
jgi:NADH-quinone oxidoreductase subunit E